MTKAKRDKYKSYFITTSIYMFVCLCIFSGLFLLLITNQAFIDAMRDMVSQDASLPWIWFVRLLPLDLIIAIVSGAAFSFLYVEASESKTVTVPKKAPVVRKTTTRKTTTKKRKK
jgi:hypothetical protein